MKNQVANQPTTQRAIKRPSTDTLLPVADHIAELRRRMLIVFIFLLGGASLSYVYRQELLAVILAPLHGQQLIYLTPGGGFAFIFQLSIYVGFIAALPLLVYQLHAFIRPALPRAAQKSMKTIVLLASLLILGGVAYGYFVAVPAAIQFLDGFVDESISPTLTASSYLSFFLAYIGGLALLSLTPLLVMFWHWINPQTPGQILRSEQYILVGAFVLAAIITPTPDILNQAMIAGPVILIYQIGVIAVLIDISRSKRRTKTLVATAEEQTAPTAHAPRHLVGGFYSRRAATAHRSQTLMSSTDLPPRRRLNLDSMVQQ